MLRNLDFCLGDKIDKFKNILFDSYNYDHERKANNSNSSIASQS